MMEMLKTAEAPELKLEMEAMQRTTASYCDEWNRRYQQLLDNDGYLKNGIDAKGDFTEEEKEKLGRIEDEANKTVVDSRLDEESENPVRNAVVAAKFKALGEEILKIKKLLPDLVSPTAEDAGKVLKVSSEGQAVWEEDFGTSWRAMYPEFVYNRDTDTSDKKHIEETNSLGYKKTTDFADDRSITETLYDPDGVQIAQRRITFNGDQISERMVE